jgi:hypothetical protein
VRPLFVWSRAATDSQYVLQLAADTTFLVPILVDTVAFDTTLLCPVMLPNDSLFFWRVGITGAAQDTLFGVARSFRTTRPPALSTDLLTFPDTRRGRGTTREVSLFNPMSDTLVVDSVWSRMGVWPVMPGIPSPISLTVVVDSTSSRQPVWRVMPGIPSPISLTVVVDSTSSRQPVWPVMPGIPCSVAIGDSAVIRLTYRPERFGTFLDTLHFATNAGPCVVSVAGLSSPPVLSLSSTFAAFGPVAFTDTAQVSVMIRNTGPINDLTLRTLTTRTPIFSAAPAAFSTISPGDSQGVRVRFHLRALRREMFGVYFDTLVVDSDGGRERVLIRGESPPPRIGVEPITLNFGDVAARDTAQYSVRIVNGSVNTLRLDSIRARRRSFSPGISRGQVRQRDTLIVPVRFVSGRHGPHADTLTLFNNSWRGPVRIPVFSFVPFPEVLPEVQHADFGPVAKNDTARLVFRFSNPAISLLRVDSVCTRTRFFRLSRPNLPFYVQTGDSLVVSVAFVPDSMRHFSDTLTIVSNAASSPDRIPLWGDGIYAGAAGARSGMPGEFELFSNYPNPFNASTTFRYAVPEPSHVRLELFTTLGQRVAILEDADRDAGFFNVHWTTGVTSGTYYYRMSATPHSDPGKTFVGTKRMVVLR